MSLRPSDSQRCLVTGGTGLIGLVLVRLLVEAGHEVRVLVRNTSDISGLTPLGVETVVGDVTLPETLAPAVQGIDTVFHLAVQRHKVKGNVSQHRAGDPAVTVEGAMNVARAAAEAGVGRLVHASSSGVAGSASWKPITETTEMRPDRPYRHNRAEAERRLAALAAEEGLAITIARITHVFGPRDLQLLPLFRMISKGDFVLLGDGAQIHHYSYVDDVAGALIAASHGATSEAPIYLVGSPPRPLWSWLTEIAVATGGTLTRRPWMVPILRPAAWLYDLAGRPMDARLRLGRKFDFHIRPWHCDLSKAQRDLPMPNPVPLAEAVARTVAWYRANGHL